MTLANLMHFAGKAASAIHVSRVTTPEHRVAGFTVRSAMEADDRWDREREAYLHASLALGAKLKGASVEPIAMLPAAWWDGVADAAGLIRVRPNASGHAAYDAENEATSVRDGIRIASYFSVPLVAVSMAVVLPTELWIASPVVAVFGIRLIPLLAESLISTPPFARVFTSAYLLLKGGPSAAWGRMFRGDGDDDNEGNTADAQVAVSFPEPPVDLAETLLRMRNRDWQFEVAARPHGMRFGMSASAVIADRIFEEGATRVKGPGSHGVVKAPLDGVVSVRLDGAVALIAEVGDCGIDKTLIARFLDDAPYPMQGQPYTQAFDCERRPLRAV